MGDLYLEGGEKAGLDDVVEWWLKHYEGIEHLTEGGTVSPETWYTINTILRRCFSRFKSTPPKPLKKGSIE